MEHFNDEAELNAVVEGFESCTTRGDAFTHGQHLAVAVWYITQYGEAEALKRMRAGLFRFLAQHGVEAQKYSETTTQFWLKQVQKVLKDSPQSSIADSANSVIRAHPRSRLIFDYFSEELLKSEDARSHWVEPDLKPVN